MRPLALILVGLMACAAPAEEEWSPAADWSVDTVSHWSVLTDGLLEPRGIARWQDAWYVAERGGGRILRIADGESTTFASGLAGPWAVVPLGDSLVVTDRDAGAVLRFDSSGASTVLLDGLVAPTEIIAIGELVYLLDEEDGSLWSNASQSALTDGLAKPTALAEAEGVIYIAESGSPDRVSSYSISTGTVDTYASNEDIPHGVSTSPAGVFFTGRSPRWPYAGWIYGGPTGSSPSLCESPPGVERIIAAGDYLLWNTYESILRCPLTGGPYEMLAPETSVGSMAVIDELITWTDRQRGAVYQTGTEPTE